MEKEVNSMNDFVQASMNILLFAGDARNAATSSVKELIAGNPEEARKLLEEAKVCVQKAHKAQTDVIQREAKREFEGKELQITPLLFIHAQDTIMTIMSEINLIELMEEMYLTMKDK